MKLIDRRLMTSVLGMIAGVVLIMSQAVFAKGKLNVYNWAEYIGEETIASFEKEYDVDVVYDVYDSVETVDAKLLAGSSGYDVVVHQGTSIGRLIPAGILAKLDKSKLPNWKNLRADILAQLAENWDPKNEYVVPYMWGTHGVTFNPDLIKEIYPSAPIGSMEMIFDPQHMKELAKCGVAFLDSPTDVIPMALAHLGLDPASNSKQDYKEVTQLLAKIRPYIKTFDNYAWQRMAEKEFCVAVTWGPDGLLAISQAEETVSDFTLDFFSPPGKGKANVWVDGWVIPADAKNIENAHLFLNYMMRPEVAAADTNYTWYANANKAATELVDEEVTGSIASYPTEKMVNDMYTLGVVPPQIERLRNRVWTKFKSGN